MKPKVKELLKRLVPFFCLLVFCQPVLAKPIELSLEDSIFLALKSHANIKVAESSRDKAYWAVNQAKGSKGLDISITHTDTHYSTPVAIDSRYSNNKFGTQLSLSYPLYSGGKLESQMEQAKLNLTVAELNLTAVQQQLTQDVTTYYFNVLQYQKELRVSQETVDNYTAHLNNVRSQYEIGTVAKSDILASQVELANAQDTLIQAQNNVQLSVAKLNNAVGLPLDSELILKEDLAYEKYLHTLADCVQYAVVNRPEIAEYRARTASAEADVKIANSATLPTVDVTLGQDWYDRDFPGLNNSNWQIGLTASMNIFDSGVNKAKVKQSQYSVTVVKAEARLQQENILLEVREAYLSMREAEKRIDIKQVAVEQAEESLKIAEARYRAGVGTNLAVFDAVVALNQAKINSIKALYDYNTSKAQLIKAMGIAYKK
ncbi:TolC family protein [Sporomusa sp.]|uniref:TolC family protein n=1 Tax=Sporomusa sp. TaxID=2078658 RepID=UPI002BA87359|nr:TolC family protein [Sporomusa sp.]HWR08277.1 TolC family protein [Sporomusa sp.]